MMDAQQRTHGDRTSRMVVHYAVFGGSLSLLLVGTFRWSSHEWVRELLACIASVAIMTSFIAFGVAVWGSVRYGRAYFRSLAIAVIPIFLWVWIIYEVVGFQHLIRIL